jgi:hypothetical protein
MGNIQITIISDVGGIDVRMDPSKPDTGGDGDPVRILAFDLSSQSWNAVLTQHQVKT